MIKAVALDQRHIYQHVNLLVLILTCIFMPQSKPFVSVHGLSLSEFRQKWEEYVQITEKGYAGMPWYVNSSQVAPIIDIWSDGRELVVVFAPPQPIATKDEVALFRSVIACLRFLESKRLALREVERSFFCHSDEEVQACKLSPTCRVTENPDGTLLQENMTDIASLGFFTNERIKHAQSNAGSSSSHRR